MREMRRKTHAEQHADQDADQDANVKNPSKERSLKNLKKTTLMKMGVTL